MNCFFPHWIGFLRLVDLVGSKLFCMFDGVAALPLVLMHNLCFTAYSLNTVGNDGLFSHKEITVPNLPSVDILWTY